MKLKHIFQKKGTMTVDKCVLIRYLPAVIVFTFFFNAILTGQLASIDARVVLYPVPASIESSPDYSVFVNGQKVFVYNPKVKTGREHPQKNMGMCYFDCIDSATVTVHANVSMADVVIRPKSYGIKPVIKDHDITFTIRKMQKVTIEPNGYEYNALVIFANAVDPNPPKQGDPNVIYFGPGIHTPGQIYLQSNQTIYLAGGAVVRGHISATGATNSKIMGHGIIDQSIQSIEESYFNFIFLENCSNITIDGPILLDNIGWCVNVRNCKNITISDMKLIAWNQNTDGIDVVGSSNCTIDNCYIRNWDDGVAIKSSAPRVHNIMVQNCIFWSDLAEAVDIGYECETDLMDSMTFKNIDIIHAFSNNAISIHNSGQAEVRDVLFEDIRIEDMDPLYTNTDRWPNNELTPGTHVVDLWIGKSNWTKTGGQGTVRNIYFKNISVTVKPRAQFPMSSIIGFDASHTIEGVTFENFTINGEKMMKASDAYMNLNSYVKNVTFR